MNKIQTQFSKNYKGTEGQTFKLPSKTIPDQNLTIAQLLKNHTRDPLPPNAFTGKATLPRLIDLNDIAENKRQLEAQQVTLDEQIVLETQLNKEKAIEAEKALAIKEEEEANYAEYLKTKG